MCKFCVSFLKFCVSLCKFCVVLWNFVEYCSFLWMMKGIHVQDANRGYFIEAFQTLILKEKDQSVVSVLWQCNFGPKVTENEENKKEKKGMPPNILVEKLKEIKDLSTTHACHQDAKIVMTCPWLMHVGRWNCAPSDLTTPHDLTNPKLPKLTLSLWDRIIGSVVEVKFISLI